MVTEGREEVPLLKLFEPVLSYQTSVYVTVLNIIQCIALAFLINEARDIIIKKEVSLEWTCRSLVALGVILVVWDRYVSELQYLWPVSWFDTLIPFFIGIIESFIVFSTNLKTASLSFFIASIAILQFWVAVGYLYTYRRRKISITERLYQTFYVGCPQFTLHLMNFLKGHDFWNFIVFLLCSLLSLVILIIITLFPWDYYELFVSIIYLFEIIQGEFISFRRSMHKDKSLHPYFQ